MNTVLNIKHNQTFLLWSASVVGPFMYLISSLNFRGQDLSKYTSVAFTASWLKNKKGQQVVFAFPRAAEMPNFPTIVFLTET